jgi:hypothetical protein
MTWRLKLLIGAVVVLAVGIVGQLAIYRHQPTALPMTASWTFHPTTLREARDRAQSIVLAKVVSVRRGDDIVTQQSGEPDGVDRIPTQRITVEVVKAYKGPVAAGQELTLFQTGGTVLPPAPAEGHHATTRVQQLVLEGDPRYEADEQYLLMLEPGPQGTLRTVSPEGRYRYAKGSEALTPMVKGAVASEVKDKRLSGLESTLRGQN